MVFYVGIVVIIVRWVMIIGYFIFVGIFVCVFVVVIVVVFCGVFYL